MKRFVQAGGCTRALEDGESEAKYRQLFPNSTKSRSVARHQNLRHAYRTQVTNVISSSGMDDAPCTIVPMQSGWPKMSESFSDFHSCVSVFP